MQRLGRDSNPPKAHGPLAVLETVTPLRGMSGLTVPFLHATKKTSANASPSIVGDPRKTLTHSAIYRGRGVGRNAAEMGRKGLGDPVAIGIPSFIWQPSRNATVVVRAKLAGQYLTEW